MLNKLCFWKQKRYWYVVWFSYTNGLGKFQTSYIKEYSRKPFTVANFEQIWIIRDSIEGGQRLINSKHARQRLSIFPSEWQQRLSPAEIEDVRREDDIYQNLKFLSLTPLDWDRA